jgi:molybdate transport system regulatory protein
VDSKALRLQGQVWMTVDGAQLGGSARIALLAQIGKLGSITQAAKAVKMSYKAAWDAIDSMNNLAGRPLVERSVGGRGGGSTRLTRRGQQLVRNFAHIEAEHRRFIEALGREAEGIADDYFLLRRMMIKTSARNQIVGRVVAVKRGSVNDEIDIEGQGGQKVVAIVTHESTEGLGLQVGTEVFALIKASSIILVTEDNGARFSARNRLPGTVSRIQTGAVNTEVVIDLGGGSSIAAIITNESSQALGLAIGTPASALFKASSVILGVPA